MVLDRICDPSFCYPGLVTRNVGRAGRPLRLVAGPASSSPRGVELRGARGGLGRAGSPGSGLHRSSSAVAGVLGAAGAIPAASEFAVLSADRRDRAITDPGPAGQARGVTALEAGTTGWNRDRSCERSVSVAAQPPSACPCGPASYQFTGRSPRGIVIAKERTGANRSARATRPLPLVREDACVDRCD